MLSNESDPAKRQALKTIGGQVYRIRDMIGKNLSLEQIQADRPSRDYDTEFSGSPEAFVASIYASLTASR